MNSEKYEKGRRIFFVSTGRCGTTRLAEILQKYLPGECVVVHQTRYSHLANVLGNINYHFAIGDSVCKFIYHTMTNFVSDNKTFVTLDPLSSMIIPQEIVTSDKTFIVHLVRDQIDFARSIYRLTRKKKKSFIAHNFFPFWQPFLFPMENMFSKGIIEKYCLVHKKKNDFFVKRYSCNPNYIEMRMEHIFKDDVLARLLENILGFEVIIPEFELIKKTNQT